MSVIRIERSGDRILLGSDAPTPGINVAIPGSYYPEASEVWSLPLELAVCHLLRGRYGNRLQIGPGLMDWARAEKARREQAEATALAADADLYLLPKVAPALFAATSTRRYQRSGIRYIVDAEGRDGRKRALLADTVGLGKTIETLGAVLENGMPGPFLIICPKTAVETTWAAEIRKWLPEDEIITLPEGRAKRDNILNSLVTRAHTSSDDMTGLSLQRTWVVVHPAIIRTQTWFVCQENETDVAGTTSVCGLKTKFKTGPVPELNCGHEKTKSAKIEHDHTFPQLFGINWAAVCIDESDQVLIRSTGTPNLQRRGAEMLRDLVPEGGIRLAISGTPFRSKPHNAWSTLNWLDPVRWKGKWSWVQRYWVTGGYTGFEVSAEGFMEDREEMMIDELKDVMIRRTRDMVRDDLPPKLYPSNIDAERDGLTPGIYLPMSKEQERAYREMSRTGEVDVAGGHINPNGVLAELTRLKQFAAAETYYVGGELQFFPKGNKYDFLMELLLEIGLPERPSTKIAIVSQYTRLLNAFAGGIKTDLRLKDGRIGGITGQVPPKKRDEYVGRFEDTSDPLDLIFLNIKAGGSSITLDAAEIMVHLDETFVADEQEQVEGRIDNRQPERRIVPRSYYYLRSRNTLEEGIAAANAAAKARGLRILNASEIAKRAKEFV